MPITDLEELDRKARPGAFSTYDMEILVPEVQKLKRGQAYLEIGVDKGKSLSVVRMATDPDVKVFGIDLRDNPEVPDTTFIHGDSTHMQMSATRIDVLFIDGDHTYEGCKADIKNWYPQMVKHGVMLFHDCDATSPGVEQAVKEFAEEHELDVFYSPNQRCSMARIYL